MMKTRTSGLRESIDLTEAKLDEGAHTVDNVRLIASGWSKNGRAYPESVLEASAKLWEGVKAYIDHPSKSDQRNRPERSVSDIAGFYESISYKDGNVYARLKLLGTHRDQILPLIKETIKSGKPLIGLSINAVGKTTKGEHAGRKGIVVESITHANSVDIVTTPAAGGGFGDSTLMMADDGWTSAVLESISIDELKTARPDILAAIVESCKTPRDSKALREAKKSESTHKELVEAANKELRTAQSKLEKALAEVQSIKQLWEVDKVIQRTTLPKEWKASLLEDLSQAEPSTWDRILDRELRKARAVKPRQTVVTGAGSLKETARNPAAGKKGVVTVFGQRDPVGLNESYSEYKDRTKKGNQ